MGFLSAKPMRASVGGSTSIVLPPPSATVGWIKPHGPPTVVGGLLTNFSPTGSAWTTYIGVPLILPDGRVFSLGGIDADNQGWLLGAFGNMKVEWHHEESTLDKIAQVFITYAPKILGGVIAVLAPGIGTIFGGALIAWQGLANKQPLSDALINATRTSFATPSALPAFNDGINAVRDGLTEDQIHKLGSSLIGASFDTDIQKAFINAVTIQRAKQVQDITLRMLKPKFSDAEWDPIQNVLDWGGPVYNALYAAGGDKALSLLVGTSKRATDFVASNVTRPDKIIKAVDDPTSQGLVATSAPVTTPVLPPGTSKSGDGGGSSSGSGSGGSGGTLLLTGAALAGGFFLYRRFKR